jgi:hypothetical protein
MEAMSEELDPSYRLEEDLEFLQVDKTLNDLEDQRQKIFQNLFNYYVACFLFCGLALLISLVGSIILTIRFNVHQKRQLTFRQLSRTESFLTFFK